MNRSHRLALRYDTFSTDRPGASPPLESDAGDAWTLSYRLAPANARFSGGIEWLRIASHRDIWPMFYSVPSDQTEDRFLDARNHFESTAAARALLSLDPEHAL